MHILKTTANLIISMIFNLFIYIVLLRFLFQWLKVDFYNPLAQAIYKFTNPIVQPMTKYIPNYKSIDFSSLILIFV
ncbi:MAG: hypothetical protein JWM09_1538, partial [Francisellaceae bacterium]|nr:hypothetical protein [Francisellaceae bacterium]